MLGESKVLREIIERLDRIIRLLERQFHLVPAERLLLIQNGGNMSSPVFSVLAGGPPANITLLPLPSGSVFDTPPDFELEADDPNAVIAVDPTDASGATFNVTVPATDTTALINLSAFANAGGKQIAGSAQMTVQPAAVAQPATSIGFQQNSGQAPGNSGSASPAPAAQAAAGKARAAAK